MSNATNIWLRGWTCFLAALLVTALAGCGSGKATVTGKVTLDGQPLEKGTISFEPVDGATSSAEGPIAAGAYSLEVPPGPKLVRISATKVIGQRQVYEGDPNSPVVDNVEQMIPPQYNAASTLNVEIKGGSSQHDFALKTTP